MHRRNKGKEHKVMGRNALSELLKFAPKRIEKVYTSHPLDRIDDPLIAALQEQGIPLQKVAKTKLFHLVKSESHQAFVAIVKPKEEIELSSFFEKEKGLLLMLDNIQDPQNLGALLRAAECFGVDGVIWSKNRGADLTPVVTKVSVGASEIVPIVKVSNLVEATKKLQKADYWAVAAEVGLAGKAKELYSYHFPEKTLLIVGSEGKGLQKLLQKQVDEHLFIPMEGKIDSLNVSQATAVILSSWRSCKEEK